MSDVATIIDKCIPWCFVCDKHHQGQFGQSMCEDCVNLLCIPVDEVDLMKSFTCATDDCDNQPKFDETVCRYSYYCSQTCVAEEPVGPC
jgi:hypothetical protein